MNLLPNKYEMMTNRELYTEFERFGIKKEERRQVAQEMAKRLNMLKEFCWNPNEERIQQTVQDFKHWKLNGAGDQRW